MQVMIGGIIAAVVGFLGVVIFWSQFITLLAGGIPIALLLGGALAIYVGYDELRDQMRERKEASAEADELEKARQELERAKAEAERYKEELEKAKTESETSDS